MARKRYSLSHGDRIQYAGILLLNYMIENNIQFPIISKGEDGNLEPILQTLRKNGFVDVVYDSYRVSNNGQKEVENFISGYSDFLRKYEVYLSVDLEIKFSTSFWP